MKRLSIILSLIAFISNVYPQISIDKNDMPVPNDTFRISTAANASSFNFKQTGANFTWDFSTLTAKSQKMESYVSVSSTPAIFQLVFMYPLVSTIARERPDAQIGTIAITDGYNFYKNTSSSFKEVGFGATIQGAPVPVQYQNADVIYTFPMNYGNIDSCDAAWHVSIPSLGYISEKKHRVNEVDGWGTVKTPYGTFNCLRLKSTVYQVDSFHYDSIPFSFPAIPSQYTEYIWLAKNTGFPILKATARTMSTSVEYIDSIKTFAGINPVNMSEAGVELFPNPATKVLNIKVSGATERDAIVRIFSINGRMLSEKIIDSKGKTVLDVSRFEKGVYFVSVILQDRIINKRFIIN